MFDFGGQNNFSQNTAIITNEGQRVSYPELLRLSEEIVCSIPPRSLVFLFAANDLHSVAAYIGCIRNKIVPVMMSYDTDLDLVCKLIDVYNPEYVLAEANKLKALRLDVEVMSGFAAAPVASDVKKSPLFGELALLLTTSGSTGSPKLVRISYENLESNTASIIKYLKIQSGDRAITTMPMNYTYGLSIINSHLEAGASLILNDAPVMNKDFWSLLKREKATTFGGVPYFYEMLKKLRFERMDLPDIKYLTQAGGKLSPSLQKEYVELGKRKGFEFIVMYGQTEATARMAYLPWEYADSKIGSMGVAIPGGKFILKGEDGSLIETADTIGELIYEGSNVTLGYAECRENLSEGDSRNGVLETGDMAKRDESGFYYIVGRKKRFLKLFGKRVNLDEIEGLLRSAGYECAAGGIDDKMVIYTTDKSKSEEIRSRISQKTGINFTAFHIIPVEQIPRFENGKIAYSRLNEYEVK